LIDLITGKRSIGKPMLQFLLFSFQFLYFTFQFIVLLLLHKGQFHPLVLGLPGIFGPLVIRVLLFFQTCLLYITVFIGSKIGIVAWKILDLGITTKNKNMI